MVSRFEHFSASISCIYRYIQKIERMEMEKYGLKGPHAQCLLAMSRYPEGITAAKICEICDKDKAAVSRALAEMEKKGLVLREGKNENLYRAKIRLTEAGEQAAKFVSDRAKVAVALAGEGLSDEDRRVFYHALDLIVTNLHNISRNGIPQE